MSKWSKYQEAIYRAVAETTDSLLIEAVAGAGKTSTIVEAINYVSRDKSVVLCAFNKSIADTLRARISAPNATCATLHSLGLRAWQGFCGGGVRVESSKTRDLIRDMLTWDQRKRMPGLAKLIGLAKQHGIVSNGEQTLSGAYFRHPEEFRPVAYVREPGNALYEPLEGKKGHSVTLADLPETQEGCVARGLMADTEENWLSLMETYDIDSEEVDLYLARKVLGESLARASEVMDYDDMLMAPIVCGAPFQQFDVVFVDEVQDLNGIQIEMIGRMVGAQGRVIAVGDPAQSIYHFRGATADAMSVLGRRFKCKALPLSISYRCPRSVVRRAQSWVQHIEAREDAPEGAVLSPSEWALKDFRASDVILCRLTRPLVDVAFKLIRARIPCRVLGRDIGAGLLKLIDKSKLAPESSVRALEQWLDSYHQAETRRLSKAEQWAQLGILGDKLDTLRIFMAEGTTIRWLRMEIESLFHDSGTGQQIRLSTIHKFKGQEAERVFVLDADELMPCKWSNDLEGEKNLAYVAATRAQSELYYISSSRLR